MSKGGIQKFDLKLRILLTGPKANPMLRTNPSHIVFETAHTSPISVLSSFFVVESFVLSNTETKGKKIQRIRKCLQA